MKRSVLTALALSASVVAAPLVAEEVKPVQPTVSTQGDPVVLGALTQGQIIVLGALGVVTVGVIAGDSSSSTSTPDTTE